jgi:predicted MPP superfamily phosphohydrolase
MLPIVLLLIVLCEGVFISSLVVYNPVYGTAFAVFQFVSLVVSMYLLVKNFRKGRTADYKAGFYAFGSTILLSVPTIVFLIPGIVYLVSLNELSLLIALSLWFLLTIGILFGIFRGRWNWKVHKHILEFENLPREMDGTTIVQISDLHIGSFFNLYHKVKPAFDKISAINPDYLVFTGDLVNNIVDEVDGWEEQLLGLKAKKGKYSILGNHDYGDYVKWDDDLQKNSNLQSLIRKHQEIGFTPLLNESVELSREFHLLGVENWGKAPFRQSGKLAETLAPIPENSFKLLLSHDPSHFDEQVVGTGIDLTLSGHTHGMQFGIERFGIKWSPVSLRYKKWAGLYQVGKQFLYVNRGFGYLGFPGRVGIYPEITHLVLRTKSEI